MTPILRLARSVLALFALLDAKARCIKTPAVEAYVISGVEERWLSTSEVLASLGIQAQRVVPVKPSLKLAEREFSVHNYDAHTDVTDVRTQREFSLLATFKKVFRTIARLPGLRDDHFALLFEDDIAVHGDVGVQALWEVLAYGERLARDDGLLYLGSCAPSCNDTSALQHRGVTFVKCASRCTHAFAVTKRRARSLVSDLHMNMVERQIVYDHGHAIDQLLYHFSAHNNLTWVAGSNLDEGIPAYVISAGGDRWRGAEEALGALGVRAERVAPVEASLQLAKAEYRVHSYANAVHFGEARTQREFSLLATFKHVLRLASKLPIGDDAFALVFEDDIAAHPAVTPASFMQALEYGAQLAAHDGLLYLGACGPDWATGTRVSHGGFDYAKAASFCTHALAVTRRMAHSLVGELHANMLLRPLSEQDNYADYHRPHCIDQLLRQYSLHNNRTWVAGANLVSPQDDSHVGLFYQDRERYESVLNS